jgi:hypothetical protein
MKKIFLRQKFNISCKEEVSGTRKGEFRAPETFVSVVRGSRLFNYNAWEGSFGRPKSWVRLV